MDLINARKMGHIKIHASITPDNKLKVRRKRPDENSKLAWH